MKSARLRILYVAYPMLPVSEESCGGAEQMLWALEAEIARRGHETFVAACEGSHIAGTLFATGAPPLEPDRFEQRNSEHAASVLTLLRRVRRTAQTYDLVHDKSGSFWRQADQAELPILATLHLPRSFYPAAAFDRVPPNVFFNCVSGSQLREFADLPRMLGVVQNGIRLEGFAPPGMQRDEYLLWLGRICEEKGTHVAIEVARRTGRPLVIAGDVYPFSYHHAYFEREIRPHLDGRRIRHVSRPRFAEKVALLRRARALLLPSLADETSSLAAMEAMACGTPVIAFRRGAIPSVVSDGVTGFVVDTVEEMARAVEPAGAIDPAAGRARVEKNFRAERMAAEYERMYQSIARSSARTQQAFTAA